MATFQGWYRSNGRFNKAFQETWRSPDVFWCVLMCCNKDFIPTSLANLYVVWLPVPRPHPLTRKRVWWPVPRPHPLTRKKVWWLLSDFLAVPSQKYWFWTSIDYLLAWYFIGLCTRLMWHYFIGLSKTQERWLDTTKNRSVVTRPFSSWEGGVWKQDNLYGAESLCTCLPTPSCTSAT